MTKLKALLILSVVSKLALFGVMLTVAFKSSLLLGAAASALLVTYLVAGLLIDREYFNKEQELMNNLLHQAERSIGGGHC